MAREEMLRNHPSHPRHVLELKNYMEPYTCNGCKEKGFGPRYRCEKCDFDLHKPCTYDRVESVSHEFFPGSRFKFMRNPPKPCHPECRVRCDACRKSIEGFVFHCEEDDLDIHPCCYDLKTSYRFEDVEFNLHKKVEGKCIWCKRTSLEDGGDDNGWSYMSECGDYHVHVACVAEMVLEALPRIQRSSGGNSIRSTTSAGGSIRRTTSTGGGSSIRSTTIAGDGSSIRSTTGAGDDYRLRRTTDAGGGSSIWSTTGAGSGKSLRRTTDAGGGSSIWRTTGAGDGSSIRSTTGVGGSYSLRRTTDADGGSSLRRTNDAGGGSSIWSTTGAGSGYSLRRTTDAGDVSSIRSTTGVGGSYSLRRTTDADGGSSIRSTIGAGGGGSSLRRTNDARGGSSIRSTIDIGGGCSLRRTTGADGGYSLRRTIGAGEGRGCSLRRTTGGGDGCIRSTTSATQLMTMKGNPKEIEAGRRANGGGKKFRKIVKLIVKALISIIIGDPTMMLATLFLDLIP
ncbi:Melanoma-associated antigen E1, partial [Cucurbita argyrosperma subsp. sororia]